MSISSLSTDIQEVKRALRHVPAEDRLTWVLMGMAVKSLFDDDAGFEAWDSWSKTAHNYDERTAERQWKSFKQGATGIGTLFHTAKLHGYVRDRGVEDGHQPTYAERQRARAERIKQEAVRRAEERERQERVSASARSVLSNATLAHHPYLSRKGFREFVCRACGMTFDAEAGADACVICNAPAERLWQPYRMLVADGKLLVPMRDVKTGAIVSVQSIDADGNKRFMTGGRKKGTMFRLGRGREIWMCEGLATALSLRHALKTMQRQDTSVVITFDAYNFTEVANLMVRGKRGVAVADNDPWRCRRCKHAFEFDGTPGYCTKCRSSDLTQPTGQSQAAATGLPVFIPSEPGDVNDLHQKHGTERVTEELRRFLGIGDYGIDAHSTCGWCGGSSKRRVNNGHVVFRCVQCGRDSQWR